MYDTALSVPSFASDCFIDDDVEGREDNDGTDLCGDERVDRVEDGPVVDVVGIATEGLKNYTITAYYSFIHILGTH